MKIVTLVATFFLVVTHGICAQDVNNAKRPHIILMMADDMGWNDVSFHGANQIPTPNIDALAYNGVILNRFYTSPACSPSRSSLLTGQYAMRLGTQGWPLRAGENRHLPLNVSTLPEKLKDLGYSTNLIGKWHLGCAYKNLTPTKRGYDYHFGFWNGYIGYFNHQTDNNNGMDGLDMHENFEPMWATQHQYATHLFTEKAEEIIQKHDKKQSLFLAIMHVAPHTGEDNKVEIPDAAENNITFGYILDENRRVYAGAVAELDESVGRVVRALSENDMLDNSVIIFVSDNGAPTVGMFSNQGSNWPLRGMKLTLMEGGIRNIAAVYSSLLKTKGTVSNDLMHITDLMPTLYAAAGGNVSQLGTLDGINQWPTLTEARKSNRDKIVIELDEYRNSSGLIGENGRYKLVNGTTINLRPPSDQANTKANDDYHGDDGRDSSNPAYNITAVLNSDTNIAIGGKLTEEKILQLRQEGELANCRQENYSLCIRNHLCLFDILNDPCETTDLSAELPDVVEKLSKELLKFRQHLLPQAIFPIDPRANPSFFNNTWHTWLDV